MRFPVALVLAFALGACATTPPADPPSLAIYGNRQTIELAPVLLAAADHYRSGATVVMGGVPNLVGATGAQGFSDPGEADLATNAETQLLRYSVDHPELRIVAGVSEGLYRIVARRSAGIARVADLKGKRVATFGQTSAGYFLQMMLERAGLGFGDIVEKPIMPLAGMTAALANREVDAVVIWEPEAHRSAEVLGEDLIEFSGEGFYRELFNLNSTADKLADPAKRRQIVAFVAGLMDAADALHADPARAQALVVEAGGFAPADVAQSWKHHRYGIALPPDLLDVMEKEETWLAAKAGRPARSRAELQQLIDPSVYREAMALRNSR
ncbi:ABC transporter substrate-binding protein [Tsuneonella sp. HG222]